MESATNLMKEQFDIEINGDTYVVRPLVVADMIAVETPALRGKMTEKLAHMLSKALIKPKMTYSEIMGMTSGVFNKLCDFLDDISGISDKKKA